MAKQPDKWERMVRKGFKRKLPANQEWIYVTDAIELLRKEHKAVVTLIKKNPLFGTTNNDWKQGYTQACQDILDNLNERAR